jgi:hypothetical protein
MSVPIVGATHVSFYPGIGCDVRRIVPHPFLDFHPIECIVVGIYRIFVRWMWPQRWIGVGVGDYCHWYC